jgi:hypothetical protein
MTQESRTLGTRFWVIDAARSLVRAKDMVANGLTPRQAARSPGRERAGAAKCVYEEARRAVLAGCEPKDIGISDPTGLVQTSTPGCPALTRRRVPGRETER